MKTLADIKVRVRELQATKSFLRQLEVHTYITHAEADECEFICWVYGPAIGRDYRPAPYFLVRKGDDYFLLYGISTRKGGEHTRRIGDHEVEFAVIL